MLSYPLICRLCLVPNLPNDTIHIFDESEEIPKKLLVLTTIEVSKDDGLPQDVCSACRDKLDISVIFKQQVERANKLLKDQLNNPLPALHNQTTLITGDLLPELKTVKEETNEEKYDLSFCGETDVNVGCTAALWDQDFIKLEDEFVTAEPWPETKYLENKDQCLPHVPVKLEDQLDVNIEDKTIFATKFAQIQIPIKEEKIIPNPRLVDDSEDDEKEGKTNHVQPVELKQSKGDNAKVFKRFSCKYCSKKYQNKMLLKKHYILHRSSKKKVDSHKNGHSDISLSSFDSLKDPQQDHELSSTSHEIKIELNLSSNGSIHNEMDCLNTLMSDCSETKNIGQESELVKHEPLKIFKTEEEESPPNDGALMHIDETSGNSTNAIRRSSRSVKPPERHASQHVKEVNTKNNVTKSSHVSLEETNKSRKSSRTIKAPERHVVPHYSCSKCERMYVDESSLKNHEKTHSGLSFKCNHCGKTYFDKDQLASHIEIRHLVRVRTTKKMHKCDICGNKYEKRAHLFSHRRIHKSPVHLCEICGKTVSLNTYFQHKRAHVIAMSQEVFQCDSCDKKFNSKLSLRSHKKSNHGDLKYTCEVCGKMFTTMALMKHHQNTHSGKRDHVCQICGRAFTLKVTLKAHLRIHTGETPFSCDNCGRSFTWKTTYKNHVASCKQTDTQNVDASQVPDIPVESKPPMTSFPPNVLNYFAENVPQESPIDYSEEAKFKPPDEFDEDVKLFVPHQSISYPVAYNMRDEIKYTYQQPINFAGDVKTFIREYKPM